MKFEVFVFLNRCQESKTIFLGPIDPQDLPAQPTAYDNDADGAAASAAARSAKNLGFVGSHTSS